MASASTGDTLTIEVIGVEDSATVSLHDNISCTSNIGSSIAIGDTVSIVTDKLSNGIHTIYVKQESSSGSSYTCSTYSLTYEVLPEPMITTWYTSSANEVITLPLRAGSNYNMTVDWGDGSPISEITSSTDPDATHTFVSSGEQTITLTGIAESWYCPSLEDRLKKVNDLGDMGWINLSEAFDGCYALQSLAGGVTDNVTNMYRMFYNTFVFSLDLSSWNTSNVTNMSGMFDGSDPFITGIESWDTSSVTDMSYMFRLSNGYIPDISGWNTSNVTDMSYMFSANFSFNQNLSGWNVGAVVDSTGYDQSAFDWLAPNKPGL